MTTKNLEEIELLLDDYNNNHSDAILLISTHLSKKKNLAAEAIIYDDNFFAIKSTDGNSSFILKTKFNLEDVSIEDLKKYLFKLIYQARRKLKDRFPKTKIELDVEKSSTSKSFFSKVKGTKTISKNIKEITFIGEFRDLKVNGTDDFMLVIVPHKDGSFKMKRGYSITDFRKQNIKRIKETVGAYYTIRYLSDNELKIWFVLHDHPANLGDWAKEVKINDEVILWGPRSLFNPPKNIKKLILFSDESGLPAMQSISEGFNENISCEAFYEILDQSCQIPCNNRANLKENWVYRNEEKPGESIQLLKALKELTLPKKDFYIFGAGEAFQMMEIRNYFKNRGVSKNQINVSGYWKKNKVSRNFKSPSGY